MIKSTLLERLKDIEERKRAASFSLHARNDIAYLLIEIKRLLKVNEVLREGLTNIRDDAPDLNEWWAFEAVHYLGIADQLKAE